MSDIHSAQPGDIYLNAKGELFRVVGIATEPTVIMQAIEQPAVRQSGGVSGLMWKGWRRIFRPEPVPGDYLTPANLREREPRAVPLPHCWVIYPNAAEHCSTCGTSKFAVEGGFAPASCDYPFPVNGNF